MFVGICPLSLWKYVTWIELKTTHTHVDNFHASQIHCVGCHSCEGGFFLTWQLEYHWSKNWLNILWIVEFLFFFLHVRWLFSYDEPLWRNLGSVIWNMWSSIFSWKFFFMLLITEKNFFVSCTFCMGNNFFLGYVSECFLDQIQDIHVIATVLKIYHNRNKGRKTLLLC